jgi:hypothetical protein
VDETLHKISPIVKSKFKQLQTTGQEAELYFMHSFQEVTLFRNGVLEDARLFGGLHSRYGSIRLAENEFQKAQEYEDDYALIVVSNLEELPKMASIINPISALVLKKQRTRNEQFSYHSASRVW